MNGRPEYSIPCEPFQYHGEVINRSVSVRHHRDMVVIVQVTVFFAEYHEVFYVISGFHHKIPDVLAVAQTGIINCCHVKRWREMNLFRRLAIVKLFFYSRLMVRHHNSL